MRFVHGDGEVFAGELRELDPPRRLAFLWGGDLLRFELEPDGDGTRLTLVHVLLGRGRGGRRADRGRLARLPGGARADPGRLRRPRRRTARRPERRERYAEYVALRFPAGAPIPGDAQTAS